MNHYVIAAAIILMSGCATKPACTEFDVEAALSDYAATSIDWIQAKNPTIAREHEQHAQGVREGLLSHVACLKGLS